MSSLCLHSPEWWRTMRTEQANVQVKIVSRGGTKMQRGQAPFMLTFNITLTPCDKTSPCKERKYELLKTWPNIFRTMDSDCSSLTQHLLNVFLLFRLYCTIMHHEFQHNFVFLNAAPSHLLRESLYCVSSL